MVLRVLHCRMTSRSLIIFLIGLFLALVCREDVLAQGAFDSACYYPEVGDPKGLDSVYGSVANQHMGEFLGAMPPLAGKQFGRLVYSGVPGDSGLLTSYETGSSFNIRRQVPIRRYTHGFVNWPNAIFGHFRSSQYLDMLVEGPTQSAHPIIYWADENGDYDSSRVTQILPNAIGDHGVGCEPMWYYIDHFSSDTVDDIVVGMRVGNARPLRDSFYFAYIKGGQKLYDQGSVANWDDTKFWTDKHYIADGSADSAHRFRVQGDFRGTGRQDLVTMDDWGNLFLFRNDPPFNLSNFVRSLSEDTLLVMKDYSLYAPAGPNDVLLTHDIISMQAFPRPAGDRSVDLLIAPKAMKDKNYQGGICMFRGGPHFGEKRIGYDSCDFLLHHPGYYDGSLGKILGIGNLGDITGTGNNVLIAGGETLDNLSMYVLGKALDDKIDLFILYPYGAGWWTTIRATQNDIPTFIKSTPYAETDEDRARGKLEVGGIQILRGANRIPVRLNAHVTEPSLTEGISVFPNPATKFFNITLNWSREEVASWVLRDILGRVVIEVSQKLMEGEQTIHVDLPLLPTGEYILEITGMKEGVRSKILVY